jgi:hypothetical protein
VKGLNLIVSICMGSSFGEVVEDWAGIVGGKLLCVVSGGSWCLFNFVDVQKAYCHIE